MSDTPSPASVLPTVFAVRDAVCDGSNSPPAGHVSAGGLLNSVSQACAPVAVISPTAPTGPPAIPAASGRGSPTRGGGNRLSPEARQRLSDAMKAKRADPKYSRRIAEASAAHWELTPEQIAICREMAANARPVREIARALGCHSDRVKARAARHGIDLWAVAAERMADAAAVLRTHYATPMSLAPLLALYSAARCEDMKPEAMQGHAKRLGLHRPEMSRAEFAALGAAARMARQAAERVALAGEVQALLDAGVSRKEAKARLHISQKRMEHMVAEGLVIVPPPPPKVPKPPRVRVRPPAPPPQPKPVVRRPNAISFGINAERPKPKPTQSVEEWLANGGQITRLPTAAVCVTTATINEADAAAIRAHREAQEAELARHGGNKWKQARENSFRKMREARA